MCMFLTQLHKPSEDLSKIHHRAWPFSKFSSFTFGTRGVCVFDHLYTYSTCIVDTQWQNLKTKGCFHRRMLGIIGIGHSTNNVKLNYKKDKTHTPNMVCNKFLFFAENWWAGLLREGWPDQNPPIGSVICEGLGVFFTNCTCILESKTRDVITS